MKVGIALGVARLEKAESALRFALAELQAGNPVELYLVFGGVGLYELAEREPGVGKLLDDAIAAGLELSACRACALAHGARGSIRCETSAFTYLFKLWRRSDRFIFFHRFRMTGG
jgi:hypothetical protein